MPGHERLVKAVLQKPMDVMDYKNQPPEMQQKIIALSLDVSEEPVKVRSQAEYFSSNVTDVYTHRLDKNFLEIQLAKYGLNGEVYDAHSNPTGILTRKGLEQKNRCSVLEYALYALAGVRSTYFRDFFPVSSQYAQRAQLYSPVLSKTAESIEQQRRAFPLIHARSIPLLRQSAELIQKKTGLSLEELFEHTAIPPVFPLKDGMSLFLIVKMYATAVGEGLLFAEIGRVCGVAHATVARVLRNEQRTFHFSSKAMAALPESLK